MKPLKYLLLSLIALMFCSCAFWTRSVSPLEQEASDQSIVDTLLARAKLNCIIKNHAGAVKILRDIGWRGYSYYRMDETLYWLGCARLGMREPELALNSFDLLRKYYTWYERDFPDLKEKEDQAWKLLAQLIKHRDWLESLSRAVDSVSAGYDGPTVSNMFFESDLVQALSEISEEAGIPISVGPMVQGYITAEFQETPLEQALAQMLTPYGFVFKMMEEGYYLIGDPSTASPSFPFISETRRVNLKYLKATQVQTLVADAYMDYLKVDSETNILTITAPESVIDRFLEDLSIIDIPEEQFMIEIMVVELGADAQRELGIDWDWTGTSDNNWLGVSKIGNEVTGTPFIAELIKIGDNKWGFDFDLRIALKALVSSGKGKLMANPRLTTHMGEEAAIHIGEEAYFSLVRGGTGSVYNSLEKITTGITLKITPYKGSYSEITNDIYVEVSDVTGAGVDNLPVTSVRTVRTKVTTSNGETFGLGGLNLEESRKVTKAIPILGQIPFIGWIFGSQSYVKDKKEIVILITPHVLINPTVFNDL